MEDVQSELIEQLFENGCISREEVAILQIPRSVIIVADIKNWMQTLDENITYDDNK